MFSFFKKNIPTVKVCMLGGKGTGKSSVLTALYKNMNESLQGTNLYVVPEEATISLLNNKYEELLHMFDYADMEGSIPPAGIAGDSEVSLYRFKFGMKGTDVSMNIEIKDFPGEKVEDAPEMVQGFIEESNAILIAVDTPHLLEENGAFNEGKNCCQIITTFINGYLEQHPDEHKLLLFVPLKCEKYYWAKTMNLVTEALQSQYKDLLDHVKASHKLSVCTTIAPILTVGDVIFDRFNKNPDGSVRTVPKGNTGKILPAEVLYKYRNSTARYSPKYCEQPLFYLLTYIAKEYEKAKAATSDSFWDKLIRRFKELFNLIGQNPEFLLEVSRLKQKRIKDKPQDGFITITGRNLI